MITLHGQQAPILVQSEAGSLLALGRPHINGRLQYDMDEAGARIDVPDTWDASLVKIAQEKSPETADVLKNALTLRLFLRLLFILYAIEPAPVSADPR